MDLGDAIWLRRVTDALVRHHRAVLSVAVVATALAAVPASRLDFDQSIESLYSPGDPDFEAYQESKVLFGGDEFVLVAYTTDELFSPAALEHLRRFADALSRVPGVQQEETQNLADALWPKELDGFSRLLVRVRKAELRELSRGLLLGDDDQTTAVILRLLPEGKTNHPRSETIARIREIAATHQPPAFVIGEAVQIHDMFLYVERDGRKLFRIALVVLAATMLVLFRSVRWMILPLLVVGAAIVWTKAVLVLSGMQLSMVSSMLSAIVTIIGIATVTHVTVHYRELRRDSDRIDSLRQTLLDLAPAVFWTCATTAVGFAALLSSRVTPVRSFGIMMALGTLMVLVASAAILPGGILLGRFSPDPRNAPAERRLVEFLTRTVRWEECHPPAVTASVLLAMLVAGYGFCCLEVETDFSKNFHASSPVRQALGFVEDRLGGIGTWEIDFPASTKDIDRVRALSKHLRETAASENWPLTKVLSLTDGLDLVAGNLVSTNPVEEKLARLNAFRPSFEPSLYNRERSQMRIVLRAREQERSESKRALIDQVERIARQEFPAARTTGVFVLFTDLIESLLRDQYVSLALATVGICSMMTLAFQSIRIGLLSLVPNLFPIVLVIGTMGWIGLPLNIATAMIASVSIGLTVDSSIHYLFGYRRARRRGLSVTDAIHATHGSVGRALVFANLALILGFTVLALSQFIPMVYFGILVSLAMLGGLIGNLILLPLLLHWLEEKRASRES